MNFLKKALEKLKSHPKLLKILSLFGLFGLIIAIAVPVYKISKIYTGILHEDVSYLREKMSKSIYKVMDNSYKWFASGTGFSVKAPSGKSYIVTNKHICEGVASTASRLNISSSHFADKNHVYLEKLALGNTSDNRIIPTKIVEISKDWDLCLLEDVNGSVPLTVTKKDLEKGDEVVILGHANGDNIMVSSGHLIQTDEEDEILQDPALASKEMCERMGFNMKTFQLTYFGMSQEIIACVRKMTFNHFFAVIYPGSSGSPVFRKDSLEVTGVIFASYNKNQTNALAITLEQLQNFLKPY